MSNVPYLVEKVVDFHIGNLLEGLADLQENPREILKALEDTEVDLPDEWDRYTYHIGAEE